MDSLNREDLDSCPINQFKKWFELAKSCPEIKEPEAMCVSTIDKDGSPDSRMVLLREVSEEGFVFYTNINSAKGRAICDNPKVSLNFYWAALNLQIRVKGDAGLCLEEKPENYFKTRARRSQLGAWASQQSQELSSREELEERVEEYGRKFDGQEVPRPSYWKGVLIRPREFQFWLQRESRLHDSFLYRPSGIGSWDISRRNP